MREVVDAVAARAAERWAAAPAAERADVVWRHRPDDLSPFSRGEGPGTVRSAAPAPAPVAGATPTARSVAAARPAGRGRRRRGPRHRRAQARVDAGPAAAWATTYRASAAHDARPRPRHRVRGGRLPEHLRVLGRRHRHVHDQRRALHPGLRLLPGRHPPPRGRSTPTSPQRVAEAVERMGLRVRRGHRGGPRRPRRRRRRRRSPRPSRPSAAARPGTSVEVLIPDCKGDPDVARRSIFDARPDVLNHNIETVARLQRAVRPSAAYARSLAVLARAKAAGPHHQVRRSSSAWARPTTRSRQTLADLRGVGVDIVTIGQYLRPDRQPPAGRPLVDARGVRPPARPPARPWASPTSRPARSPGRATTPSRPPAPPAPVLAAA